jgi:hypothetical protein
MSAPFCQRDVNSITDLLYAIRESGLTRLHHSHIRVWFRGQSNAAWELSPGVYRPSFGATNEDVRLLKERHLTQDFRAMSAGLLPSPKNEAESYFVQQHYRMPTRLLDWTTSPLAAVHFAVESGSQDDGAIVALDAYTLGPDQGGQWKDGRNFQGIASSRSPLFEESLWPIFRWRETSYFPNFILPVRPDQFDRRISLQRGCFTFHPPGHGTLTKESSRSLTAFRIPAGSKGKLREELALLAVDQFSIFGDLDHLAEYLRYVHSC